MPVTLLLGAIPRLLNGAVHVLLRIPSFMASLAMGFVDTGLAVHRFAGSRRRRPGSFKPVAGDPDDLTCIIRAGIPGHIAQKRCQAARRRRQSRNWVAQASQSCICRRSLWQTWRRLAALDIDLPRDDLAAKRRDGPAVIRRPIPPPADRPWFRSFPFALRGLCMGKEDCECC